MRYQLVGVPLSALAFIEMEHGLQPALAWNSWLYFNLLHFPEIIYNGHMAGKSSFIGVTVAVPAGTFLQFLMLGGPSKCTCSENKEASEPA